MSKVILFSGVHGVGKGYFLKQNITEKDNLVCCTASILIEKYKVSDDAGYKRVSNINDNQDILLKALAEFKTEYKEKNILLDAHLCMLNKDGQVTRIPENFVKKADICGIIILSDSAEMIYDRLNLRDSKTLQIEKIIELQREEQLYAKYLKKKYRVNFENVTHKCDRNEFLNYVEGMW